MMQTLIMSRDEFEEFRRLQIKLRWDWPAVFSANSSGEIWPFVCYGHTAGEHREGIRGFSRIVDNVADEYLIIRNDGGRFFINNKGAFYKDIGGKEVQFLVFQIL